MLTLHWLRKLWKKLTSEPLDLDKAIKGDKKIAKGRYILSAILFVIGVFTLVGFGFPVLESVSLADITPYERLAAVSGVAIVMILPFSFAVWEYVMGMQYDQSAINYRLRKIEKQLFMSEDK